MVLFDVVHLEQVIQGLAGVLDAHPVRGQNPFRRIVEGGHGFAQERFEHPVVGALQP